MGGGGGGFFPDRVDLPFVVEERQGARISETRFGHEGRFGWHLTAPFAAYRVLFEFLDSNAWTRRQRRDSSGNLTAPGGLAVPDWRGANDAATIAATDAEIVELIVLAETERADALGEIVAQDAAFSGDLLGLLDARPGNRHATVKLAEVCMLVGGLAAHHFKLVHDRPRPSQVCPALLPPVGLPGHAAYPSGHATQATLFALAMSAALGARPASGSLAALPALPAVGVMPALAARAARIARNREIAGLHYRSDSVAGQNLAIELLQALRGCASFGEADGPGLLGEVRTEWAAP
jgi:hypothetical protein